MTLEIWLIKPVRFLLLLTPSLQSLQLGLAFL